LSDPRITPTKLAEADAKKKYYKDLSEAEEYRRSIEPTLTEAVSQRGKNMSRPSPIDRLEEARLRGAEWRMWETGYSGDAPSKTQMRQSWTTAQAVDYAKYLASLGKNEDEIQRHIAKLGSTLDIAASDQYRNPFFQTGLMARTAESDHPFGVRDFVESVQMINTLQKPTQNGSDTAAIIAALGSFISATKGNSSDLTTIQGLYQQMSQQQQACFDKHLELSRDRMSEQPSFQDQLAQIVQVQSTLGKLSGRETEAVQTRRLELDHEKWKASLDAESEKRKSQGQMEMVKQLTGGLSRALENPVIRELGKSVGSKIGVRENPLENAKVAAAQQQVKQLSNPLEATYGFSCQRCKQPKTFSELQMARIKEADGKWMCDTAGCGEVYSLRDMPTGPK